MSRTLSVTRRWSIAVVLPTIGALLAWPGAPAAPAAPAPAGLGAAAVVTAPAGYTYPVTLLTGDVVALHQAPDGRQAAWLAEPAVGDPAAATPTIYQLDGEVYVIPDEAEPYLAAGVLDERLFNVTALVDQGYDDRSRADLPLLLAAADLPALPASMTPAATTLGSIDAVSVAVDKAELRTFWEVLRGPEPAGWADPEPALAAAEQVWLNGRVEALLGDSVDHIGAPAAWDAGFDGSGVAVAVLDTGYDPAHPDLAGQVRGSANFTEDADPPGVSGMDRHGHGTHVAATIAGTGAASDGARPGVAPGAELLVGKVLGDSGGGYDDWVIAGMEWAVAQGAQVVNLSLGGSLPSDGTDPLSLAVDRLTEESGTLFVIAAGNTGPREQTVVSPGAASLALTVGASDPSDAAAAFSSRGPRPGDLAIKPELVAPGVEIVAARATGTSLGNLLDDDYTSMSGTSMAAPHVAGAAAIVAQQHPDYRAAQLKSRLVATATPVAEPVSFQGAGRLDVASAVNAPVAVSKAALWLGEVEGGDRYETRTLTYHNHSDEPVTLRLTPEITAASLVNPHRPVVRVRPSALVVPAGGTASADISLVTQAIKPGTYTGHIVAADRRNRSAPIRTVFSATVPAPIRTVTVEGITRDGGPVGDGTVLMWNAETGEVYAGGFHAGTATLEVPAGQYALSVVMQAPAAGMPAREIVFTAEPELTIVNDTTLRYDARDAEQFSVTTPHDTVHEAFNVLWYRDVGDRSLAVNAVSGLAESELYLLPGRQARTGAFETTISWREAEPLLRLTGPGGSPLTPEPRVASAPVVYAGEQTLPVVYAGSGTPEEFAQVDAAGAVAVVARVDEAMQEQADAAAQAGAALLLVHNTEYPNWREVANSAPLPTYRIDQQVGEQLRDLLDADPALTLEVAGVADSSYSYQLSFTTEGAVPAGGEQKVNESDVAVVESAYPRDSARSGLEESWIPYPGTANYGVRIGTRRNGPAAPTEYVSTDNVSWQRFGQPHLEFPGLYWSWSLIQQYQPGETYQETWWGPLTRPGVPAIGGSEQFGLPAARYHDALRLAIPTHLYDNGRVYGFSNTDGGDLVEMVVRRDGEVLATAPWSELQVSVPPGEAEYELELLVRNGSLHWADTSVVTESTWRFRSGRPASGRQVLPLVQVDYHLDAGLYNEVSADTPYPLRLVPGYQPGFDGPGGFTVAVEISYDDGTNWTSVPVMSAGGAFEATLPAAGAGAEFGSVRVVVSDTAGNELSQRIERGWRIDRG